MSGKKMVRVKEKQVHLRLLAVVLFKDELRKIGVEDVGPLTVGDMSDLAEVVLNESVGWSGSFFVADRLRPAIRKQLPELAKISTAGLRADNFETWLEKQVEKHGEYHPIQAIAA